MKDGDAMEYYSYVNIFETKGVAYILLLSFLVLAVMFLRYISGSGEKNPERKDKRSTTAG